MKNPDQSFSNWNLFMLFSLVGEMFEFIKTDVDAGKDPVLTLLLNSMISGDHSDVNIIAFDKRYPLHKLILAASGFFKSAFQWSIDSGETPLIEIADIESSKEAFELCIGVLYGYKDETQLREKAIDVMIMAQYLDIPHIVDFCIDWVVQDITLEDVGELVTFSVLHSYQRLTDTCVAMLSMNGWEAELSVWENVPVDIISSIMKSNWFFVPSEWDRCLFLLDLLKLHNDDKILKDVLNNDIMFYHFSHHQLLTLSGMTSLIDSTTLKSALWKSVQLQHHIVSNKEFTNNHKWKLPTKDETLSGLIPDLIMKESEQNETIIPPFRFSVAFSNVSNLPPNKRIYSKTFWYLGSYWNVYLQKSQLPSTGQFQIGIYLHRANSIIVSSVMLGHVTDDDTCVTGFNCGANGSKNGIQNENIFSQKENKIDDVTSVNEDLSNLKLNDSNSIFIPYEDKRDDLNVYFSFYTPSRTNKPEITSFFSIPNKFSLNQSWGWKSNNLCQFTPQGRFLSNDDKILKFIIVLGQ